MGDGGLSACGQPGEVNGTVMGHSIAPVMRAQQLALPHVDAVFLHLDELGGACGTFNTTGQHLVLAFCAAPAVGTYPIAATGPGTCPSNNAGGFIEENEGQDIATGIDGSITILSVTSKCVIGSFSIDYANAEQLTGSFNAQICE